MTKTFILIIAIFFLSFPVSEAVEQPEWYVGDVWRYEVYDIRSGKRACGEMEIKYMGFSKVTINEEIKEAILFEYSKSVRIGGINESEKGKIYCDPQTYGKLYERIKTKKYIGDLETNTTYEYTYFPSKIMIRFPLKLNSTWKCSYTVQSKITGGNQIITANEERNLTSQCIALDTVSTFRGLKKSYIIKITNNGENFTLWYSEHVRFFVKYVDDNEEIVLRDYHLIRPITPWTMDTHLLLYILGVAILIMALLVGIIFLKPKEGGEGPVDMKKKKMKKEKRIVPKKSPIGESDRVEKKRIRKMSVMCPVCNKRFDTPQNVKIVKCPRCGHGGKIR